MQAKPPVNSKQKPGVIDEDLYCSWLSWAAMASELRGVAERMIPNGPRDPMEAYATVNSVALRLEQMIRRGEPKQISQSWAVARDDTGAYFAFIGREGSSWMPEMGQATLFFRRDDARKAALACHVEAHVVEVESPAGPVRVPKGTSCA